MKNYFIQYKPFLVFLGKFLLSYLVFTFIYESYLNGFDANKYQVDGFTKVVTNHTVSLLKLFGSDAYYTKNAIEPCMNIYYNQKFMARIIEGCNGLSVIILFASFVIAFTGKWLRTVLFIISGSVLIHILNIVRIALLCVLMYYFPAYESVLHGVIFPLFIYGVVFILWIIWVNKFSIYAKN